MSRCNVAYGLTPLLRGGYWLRPLQFRMYKIYFIFEKKSVGLFFVFLTYFIFCSNVWNNYM